MPAESPLVHLDSSDVCEYCRNYTPFEYKGEDALKEILDSCKNSEARYDCIVNISGGRDSSYVLLSMVKDYNMKVLALNYKNPFTSEQAEENIKNAVKILKVPLIRFELPTEVHKKLAFYYFRRWYFKPSFELIPFMCVGCKLIWNKIIEIAKRFKVRCIINGGNPYEYTSFKKKFFKVPIRLPLHLTYILNIGGLLWSFLKNISYVKTEHFPIFVKAYLFANQYSLGTRILGKGIKMIDYFHYIPWDEEKIIKRITKELNWNYPKELSTTWRFDCSIGHLKDYMYLKTVGINERYDFYSKLIREDKMKRDEAIRRIKKETLLLYSAVKKVLSRFKLNLYI